MTEADDAVVRAARPLRVALADAADGVTVVLSLDLASRPSPRTATSS